MTIRRAEPSEAAAYADCASNAFFEAYRATAEPENMARHRAREFGEPQQRRELEDPAFTVLAACEPDGAWAGFVALHADVRADGVTAVRPIEIWRFYTREKWYGRGLAQLLMQSAFEFARSRGHDGIWLQVWEHNARARRFYEKSGFGAVGRKPFLFGEVEENDVVYEARFGLGAPLTSPVSL